MISNGTRPLDEARDAGVDFQFLAIYTDAVSGGTGFPNTMFGHVIPDDAGMPIVGTSTTSDLYASIVALAQFPGTPQAGQNFAYEGFVEALSPPLSAISPIAGFLRADASLAFVVMQDEYDISLAGLDYSMPSPAPVDYYFQALASIKGLSRLDLMTVNIASVLADFSCAPGASNDIYRSRYTDMLALTGGSGTELCDPDWATNFAPLRAALFTPRSRFQLAGIPDSSSLSVAMRSISDGGMKLEPRRDGERAEACQPRVCLKAAGVISSSFSPKRSRWVPRRSKAQAR